MLNDWEAVALALPHLTEQLGKSTKVKRFLMGPRPFWGRDRSWCRGSSPKILLGSRLQVREDTSHSLQLIEKIQILELLSKYANTSRLRRYSPVRA